MAGPHSFVQTDFRGGQWSENAQGRMEDDRYKSGMNICLNGWPIETGAWMRRPGFRFVCHTRNGLPARLLPFRFSREQAYQAEFTNLKVRFIAGLELVMDDSAEPFVISISNTTPARVLVSSLPADWLALDTVMFNITTLMPSTYALFGRQFLLRDPDVDTNTFSLYDPLTDTAIDGSTIDFIPRDDYDTVQKVLEFNTSYTTAMLGDLRSVQAVDNIMFFCPDKPPYRLRQDGDTQFDFDVADFLDGPYFDINETVTTLTPDAATGTITMTASQAAGINNGDGFITSDVGRLIRFQCSPPEWLIGTTYNTNSKVLGSDQNIYRSIKSNVGHDPTTDDGTYWEITPDTVFWTWLEIVSITTNLIVEALVRGPDLQIKSSGGLFGGSQVTLQPTTQWRLGVYTNTPDQSGNTRWPTCGGYFDGRLWLAGAVPNRYDTTKTFGLPEENDQGFNFAPTETDGTVADDSGLTGVIDSNDNNTIVWMTPGTNGLLIGTASAEYTVRASHLDDPITPTDASARPLPESYGCANIEPVKAFGNPVFVQAKRRKVLTNIQKTNGSAGTLNLSMYADDITTPSIIELAWMQEPALALFALRSDGGLIGCTYRYSTVEESFYGWHTHEHALGRTFEAISYGPNFQSTGDALYVVTNGPVEDPTDPEDTIEVRWVETIMPVSTPGDQEWVAWHTDASSTAWFIRRMIVANGDSFDGIRVFGLHHLNGIELHPWIGGLDLGDFLVEDGQVDIPYAGLFTADFIDDLSDGTDYGDWGMTLRWADVATSEVAEHPINSVSCIDDDAGALDTNPSRYTFLYDQVNELAYRYGQQGAGTGANCIRVFNGITGALVREADGAQIFAVPFDTYPNMAYDAGPAWQVTGSGTYLFGPLEITGSDCPYGLINATDLEMVLQPILAGDHFEPPHLSIPVHYDGINLVTGLPVNTDFAVIVMQEGITTSDRIAIVGINIPLTGPPVSYGISFDETWDAPNQAGQIERILTGCRNRTGEKANYSDFFIWGTDDTLDTSTRINIYQFQLVPTIAVPAGEWTYRLFATIEPSDINAGWTTILRFSIAPDPSDGNLVCLATRNGGSGTADYIFKVSIADGSIMWKSATAIAIPAGAHFGPTPRLDNGWWYYMKDDVAANTIYGVNLADGSALPTLTGFVKGFSSFSGFPGQHWFDGVHGTIVVFSDFTQGATVPTYLGDWANAHDPAWVDQWSRIWLGLAFTQDQDHREASDELQFIPVNFGISFTSRGQLLRPDYGYGTGSSQSGQRAGSAFGKTRRNHRFAAAFNDSYNVTIGTEFDRLDPIKFTTPGGTAIVSPTRFTGSTSDNIRDDNTLEGKIAWEVTRQYPCTITAMSGFLDITDR